MKKRPIILLLSLALLLGALCAAPAAAEMSTLEKAQALSALGLFKGKTLPDGSVDFALEDGADRATAATMLVRLLGKEAKAQAQMNAGTLKCPFSDVGQWKWAQANVTWLYENNYVNGSGGAYAGTAPIDAQAFAAMVLRSLGYSETTGDFAYAGALDFAVSKGLLTAEQRSQFSASFVRGGMVEMCYNALDLTMRDSSRTLRAKLTDDGVFEPGHTALSGAKALKLTLKYKGGGHHDNWSIEPATLCPPVAADVNGDGKRELLYAGLSLFCLEGATGKVLWKTCAGFDRSTEWKAYGGFGRTDLPVLTADLDGDGGLELVTVSTNYAQGVSRVCVYDSNGYFKPGWPQSTSTPVYALHLADLDGDGRQEVCVGMGTGDSSIPSLCVYDAGGKVVSGWPQTCGYGLFSNSMASADLDGDGVKELVLLFDDSFVCAYNGDGSPVAATGGIYQGLNWNGVPVCENYDHEKTCVDWARAHGGVAHASGDLILGDVREERNAIMGTRGGIVAEDLDGNGSVELACTALVIDGAQVMRGDTESFKECGRYFTAFILNTDRTRYVNAAKGFDWTQMPTDPGAFVTIDDKRIPNPKNLPAVADVDADGNKEILYSSSDGMVHCWSLDGTEHGAWPYVVCSRSSPVLTFATQPVCGDVNGDGKQEVVFASYTQTDQIGVRGKLFVLDCTGKCLAQTDLPTLWGADTDRADYGPNGATAQPCLADLDGDGKLEIAVTTLLCGAVVYDIA